MCSRLFPRTRKAKKFCSDRCRYDYHNFGSVAKARASIVKLIKGEVARQLKAALREHKESASRRDSPLHPAGQK